MVAQPSPTPRFGTREKAIYASGYLGVSLFTFSVSQWLQSYYVPTSGADPLIVSAALLGTAMVWAKIIDGFADPIAGYLSDTARTPLGRRRPFLLIFGPLTGLCFWLLFPRIGPGEQISFAQLLITLCAYYFTYTMAVTPYLALLPEIAQGDKARLGVTTWQTFFNFAGIAMAMILGAQIRTNPLMAPALAILGTLAFVLPGLLLREAPQAPRAPGEAAPHLGGMFTELWGALKSRLFRLYVFSQLCMWFGFNMILAWMPYLVERMMRAESVTTANLAVLGTALLTLPLAYKLVVRVGKVRGLMLAMTAFACGFLLLGSIGRLPAPPINLEAMAAQQAAHGHPISMEELRANFHPSELTGDPATPNQRWSVGLVVLLGLGLPLAIFFLTPNAIMAEVIDVDQGIRGGNREGMFFAAQAVVIQSGGAASGWVLNRVITEGGERATLAGIATVGPVAAAILLVGVAILAWFGVELQRGHVRAQQALE